MTSTFLEPLLNYLSCNPNLLPQPIHNENYKQRWFNQRNFFTFLSHDENIEQNWLEIGSFEGLSTNYCLDHILKNEKSKITVIDPWIKYSESTVTNIKQYDQCYDDIYNRFLNNIEYNKDRIIIKRGLSQDILPTLTEKYDFILIDGDHSEKSVWNDGVNSFKLVKMNGIIIFDDYKWRAGGEYGPNGPWGPKSPKNAVDRFLREYESKIKVLGLDIFNQVIIKKIAE